jgi:hypothetical protein
MRLIGHLAGVAIVLGCAILRLRSVEGPSDYALALGLILIEIGAIVAIECEAAKLRKQTPPWDQRRHAEDLRERQRASALAELNRQVGLRDENERQIEAHIGEVADRQPRFATLDEAIAAVVARVLKGYHAGIAKNRGFILGTPKGRK